MKLSVGIVGLPNVGKSTLFKALTQKEVEVANYPFATIDPNVGVVKVPDERLDKLAELFHSRSVVPAIVEFVDIAGLVKGANKGEGLGNQFLANIREVAAICHVVRAFENIDIIHVEQGVDPVRDIEIINTELMLKDLETLEKRLNSIEKEVRAKDKIAVKLEPILKEIKECLNRGVSVREYVKQNPEAEELIFDLQFLTSKPVIFLVNTDKPDISETLKAKIEEQSAVYVAMSLKDELEISQLSLQEAQELGMRSRLPELINRAYEMLGLITFLTSGEDETRAWTIKKGTAAPDAAGEIHSDFREQFIKAMVIQWDNLLEAGAFSEATARGWVRMEGKEYIVQDGDVLEIKHG